MKYGQHCETEHDKRPNKGKEKSLERKHPWLFSGAINRIISDSGEAPFNGELIEIVDSKNNFLATGHFSDATIAVRIISFKQEKINQNFMSNERYSTIVLCYSIPS